ncbi:unnamed protein product [Rotaria sp. Silwood1]|nr:unnamed protein product [Rotaria sp. Silwood1]
MSIAELEHTFSTQTNPPMLRNQQAQQSSHDQNLKPYIDHQHSNHQEHNRNVTRSEKLETSFPTTQKVSNNRSKKAQVKTRTMCEQPSPIDSYNYLPVIQRMTEQISHSHNHGQHSLTNNKKSSSHDSFKYVIPQQEQAYCQAKHAQIVLDESMAINHNLALELNVKEKSQSHNTSHQTKNYSELKANTDFSDMQIIDVRHKLNLIEQDRMQTVQPYVLSVRFKKNYDNDQLLCDIELRTVVTVQTGSFSLLVLRKK